MSTDTLTTGLTERYVYAAIRTLLPDQRAEIEPELRELVGDAVQAKLDAGLPADEAERAALTELGDPVRLAADYADRPLHLIGPRYYLEWWQLLKLILVCVVPIVVVIAAVVAAFEDGNVGAVIGQSISAFITTTVHIGFWTTLVFVVLERSEDRGVDGATSLSGPWTPERLPDLPNRPGPFLVEAVVGAVLAALWAGALVWQQVASSVHDAAGDRVPVLQPDLWSFWLPFYLALAGLQIVFFVAVARRGRWTWPLVGVAGLLDLAFALPAMWLVLDGRLLNQEFFDLVDWPEGGHPTGGAALAIALGIAVISVWDLIDKGIKAWRAERAGGDRATSGPLA
jgi:hypothetical protein